MVQYYIYTLQDNIIMVSKLGHACMPGGGCMDLKRSSMSSLHVMQCNGPCNNRRVAVYTDDSVLPVRFSYEENDILVFSKHPHSSDQKVTR